MALWLASGPLSNPSMKILIQGFRITEIYLVAVSKPLENGTNEYSIKVCPSVLKTSGADIQFTRF
tara:strand:+ start:72 stop:266 length:195 start_codon:yes stop_codon:yes gene_type:complete